MTPTYHLVCHAENGVDGQTASKRHLLFKVKAIAYIGASSNSVITNTSDLFHFCLVSFCCYCWFPLAQNGNWPWCLQPPPAVSTFFPSRIQSSSITDGLGMIFVMLPPLSHHSDALTTLCQCLSHKAKLNSIAGFFLLSLSGLLRKRHHLQSRFISAVHLFSYSVQLFLLGTIFLI